MNSAPGTAHGEARLVVPFEGATAELLAEIGGKGAGLGGLVRAGFPVPPGFCITTAAYRRIAAGAGLEPLLEALAAIPAAETARLETEASRIRAALEGTALPAVVEEAVLAAYRGLGPDLAVAVRSSATAEDLPGASFAGQQDTYLGIQGERALLDAVRRCQASLWTGRAVVYRAAGGIDHRQVALAVVVQRMVEPRAAGVLFTANPLTGRRRQAVIDATVGLGEAVVSGAVVPDHLVVDPGTGRVQERQCPEGRPPCISDEEAVELGRLGTRVEASAGRPQDIEWAIDAGGRIWLLQARPITTLFPLPAGAPPPDGELRVYVSGTLDEGFDRPMTPMGLQALGLLVAGSAASLWDVRVPEPAAGVPAVVEAGMRMYWDVSPVLRSTLGRRLLSRSSDADASTAESLRAAGEDPRLSPRRTSLLALVRILFKPLPRLGVLRAMSAAWRDPALLVRTGRAMCARILELADCSSEATPADRLDAVERLLFKGALPWARATMLPTVAGMTALRLARALLGKRVTEEQVQRALRGLPDNPTLRMNLDLWALARRLLDEGDDAPAVRQVREQPPEHLVATWRRGQLPASLQEGMDAFLREYGHRGVAEIDLGLPRWSEDPAHLFGALANYFRLEAPDAAPDVQFERAVREGEAAVEALLRLAGPIRRPWVRRCLRAARGLLGLRELPKFQLVAMVARARAVLRPVGEALVRDGRLEAVDDIFFLDLREARRALGGEDMRAQVRSRRETYAHELRRRHIPAVFLSDGTEPSPRTGDGAASDPDVLRGLAASPGKVTARARVILDPHGARLEPGEILVAPSTDPGWTPLFLTASGLVMERGGPMAHGAVIAREYGIPAVVAVAGAMDRIRTGQELTLDGVAGTVRLGRSSG